MLIDNRYCLKQSLLSPPHFLKPTDHDLALGIELLDDWILGRSELKHFLFDFIGCHHG